MHIYRFLITILGLLLLAGICSAAAVPDQTSSISSSAGWVVVNHQSTITVTANNASVPIPNAIVSVSLGSPSMGTLAMAGTTTDAAGQVTGTFTAGSKSGSVDITATITSDNYTVTKTFTQYIDHDTAYSVQFTYDNEVTVASETPFNMSFTDRWGNPVDNKNPGVSHPVSLHTSSANGWAAFNSGGSYVQDVTVSPDASGNAGVTVRTDTAGGENIIWMKSFGSISDKYLSIIGITDGIPYSITQLVTPDNPAAEICDGAAVHKFTFEYTLYDKYGNLAVNQPVRLHTDWPGETDADMVSNDFGKVMLTYGPRESAGIITITATALANTSVSCSKTVEFYSTAPVNMVLMASPESMGSFDTDATIRSEITAEVTDIKGNPVRDEVVTFSLGTPVYAQSTYVITSQPELESTTAVTDNNGYAVVRFKPGGFTRNKSEIFYDPQATGQVTATATWTNVSQNILLTWKNYPYLSVETSANPVTIPVNGTIDLTVKLKGDGWALQPDPIDVVLVIDRSGSMGSDSPTRISSAQAASETFVGQMNPLRDRIGVVSYAGYTSGTETRTDIALTNDYSQVNSTIDSLAASGATETRDALRQAIELLVNTPNYDEKAVKAVVLMTDGNYNWLGNPLGRGTGYTSAYTSFSTSSLEPNKYRYYDGLGGTLTPALAADFTGTATGTAYQVQFTDKSTGTPTSWNWQYRSGGGWTTFSNAQNPLYTFGSATTYSIRLTVTNADGSNTLSETNYISIGSKGAVTVNTPSSTPMIYSICTDGQLTEQNMSVYAKNHGIRLYMISFASTLDDQAVSDMIVMADSTRGFYEHAPDGTQLAEIYKKIAGDLKEVAGVNTAMTVKFDSVNVTGVSVPGAEIYDYIYDPTASTKITWQDGITNVTDQTADWNTDYNLDFNIGNIKLGDVWQATVRLKIKQAGNIEVFGPTSSIVFNNGVDSINLPRKFVNVVANVTNAGWTMQAIQLNDLKMTPENNVTESITANWNLTYPGTGTTHATERVFYSNNNKQSWVLFDTISDIDPCPPNTPQSATLDVRNLPSGTYYFRILAIADDAVGDEIVSASGVPVKKATAPFIRLE